MTLLNLVLAKSILDLLLTFCNHQVGIPLGNDQKPNLLRAEAFIHIFDIPRGDSCQNIYTIHSLPASILVNTGSPKPRSSIKCCF